MTCNYSNLSGAVQACWDKIKENSRRGKSKDFEIRLRLYQNVGAGWFDRWKIGEAPRSNGTHKKHGGTLGFLRDVRRCLFVPLEIRTA